MNHRTAPRFWRQYNQLPEWVQEQADRKFRLLKKDPRHPSLHFKKVGRYWSARVNRDFRALALDKPDGIYWFWIGPHDEYERLIA
jgi:hypothetical protein